MKLYWDTIFGKYQVLLHAIQLIGHVPSIHITMKHSCVMIFLIKYPWSPTKYIFFFKKAKSNIENVPW